MKNLKLNLERMYKLDNFQIQLKRQVKSGNATLRNYASQKIDDKKVLVKKHK